MVGGEDVAIGVLEVAEDIRGAADTQDDWDTEDGEEDVGIVGGMDAEKHRVILGSQRMLKNWRRWGCWEYCEW